MSSQTTTSSDKQAHPDARADASPHTFQGFHLPPRTAPRSLGKKDSAPGFNSGEHAFLGNSVELFEVGTAPVFTLDNGIQLNFGEISCLAGDYYGTYNPISDGITDSARRGRFAAAFEQLNGNPIGRQPDEGNKLLGMLRDEVQAIEAAWSNPNRQNTSPIYQSLPDRTASYQIATEGRLASNAPGYLELAAINWDHFGKDAVIAYSTGHAIAIDMAFVAKDVEGLKKAYVVEAFAQHFLQDLFAAGHLRTPRRYLHTPPVGPKDLLAKYMHDEENNIGLTISRADKQPAWKGQMQWRCYGDSRLGDYENEANLYNCIEALWSSAAEVYWAYNPRKKPVDGKYAALGCISSKLGDDWWVNDDRLPPLYNPKDPQWRRVYVENRTQLGNYTPDRSDEETLAVIEGGSWWNYLMTYNGGGGQPLPWPKDAQVDLVGYCKQLAARHAAGVNGMSGQEEAKAGAKEEVEADNHKVT